MDNDSLGAECLSKFTVRQASLGLPHNGGSGRGRFRSGKEGQARMI